MRIKFGYDIKKNRNSKNSLPMKIDLKVKILSSWPWESCYEGKQETKEWNNLFPILRKWNRILFPTNEKEKNVPNLFWKVNKKINKSNTNFSE